MILQPAVEIVTGNGAGRCGRVIRGEATQPAGAWNRAALEYPEATAFHTEEWAATLQRCYGFFPVALRLGGGAMPVLVPAVEIRSALRTRRAVALPFSDYCEPLGCAQADGKAAAADLLRVGRERQWRSVEVRGGDAMFTDAPPCDEFLTHMIDLVGGQDAIWARCSDSARRAIRKARSAGVSVRKDGDEAGMREFHRLQCVTRRKHGLPPQPWRFFSTLREQMIESGLGRLYLAQRDGRTIAGAVFLHFGRRAVFKYGASLEEKLGVRPNNLLMWQAIADYAASGFAEMNLGRTETANAGLRRYKCGFGAAERTLRYYRYDFRRNCFQQKRPQTLLRLARPILRTLPVPVLRAIGALAYGAAA